MIYDGGHTQPDKAQFVTCQSWHDFIEKLGPAEEIHFRRFRILDRDMFQCRSCGRIFVQGPKDHDGYYSFVPEGENVPRELFRTRESREGEA
jgi:hypothetical protein